MEKASSNPKFKRIVLKISGEMLRSKENGDTICPEYLKNICTEIKAVHDLGVEVAIVVGGGNIFRGLAGAKKRGVDRTTGDYMGMLATVINGLALMDSLEKMGADVRLQSAIPMKEIAEPFILRKTIRHMEKRRIIIFIAGTGHPYFSTDTTAALRASEINADAILKATKVNGVYDKDPHKFNDAVKYDTISFDEALRNRLNIMDSTAFSMCLDNHVPILIFDLNEHDSLKRAIMGEKIGTLVS